MGRHSGLTVLGPRFTRKMIRHGNREAARHRDTLVLEPDDGVEPDVTPTGYRPGRHRRQEQPRQLRGR